MSSTSQSVRILKGIGPQKANCLQCLGIRTIGDLLHYYPRTWEDRRPSPCSPPPEAPKATFLGRVLKVYQLTLHPKLALFKAILRIRVSGNNPCQAQTPSSESRIEALWFKRPSRRYDVFAPLRKQIMAGSNLWVTGKWEGDLYGVRKVHVEEHHPEGLPNTVLHTNRIVPVYTATDGLSGTFLRELTHSVLRDHAADTPDSLPDDLIRQKKLPSAGEALKGVHFPATWEEHSLCRRRLAYEEFLLMQMALMLKKRQVRSEMKRYRYKVLKNLLTPFKNRLGFELTPAQKRVVREIFDDLMGPCPMNRLLQGDVGSGKTVVAASALLLAVENGYQAALMAPTEILAEQHKMTLDKYFKGLPVSVEILTSGLPAARKRKVREGLESGSIRIVVGTHALIEDEVKIPNLALAVVDEQHRFGVRQRALLRRKGPPPDMLVMTATPIPRTLSLTLYGDLDVSILDELPPGRKPIRTEKLEETQAYRILQDEIRKGHQGYVVFPLIEESDRLELKSVVQEAEVLKQTHFRNLRTAVLHGKMHSRDKETVLTDFLKGSLDILFCTQVIEVGIDVPNATVMIIQHAERFGLATLHQLRGRVGRGGTYSHCLLIAEPVTQEAKGRIETLCRTQDGFQIGEMDLRLRGPGEILGTLQHGLTEFKIGDIFQDTSILLESRKDAQFILEKDPKLALPQHSGIREILTQRYQEIWRWIDIS